MTYHAGVGPRLAAALGIVNATGPLVSCDGDGSTCANFVLGTLKSGGPASWLLNCKAPPGWKMIRVDEPFSRKDYCPSCKQKAPNA